MGFLRNRASTALPLAIIALVLLKLVAAKEKLPNLKDVVIPVRIIAYPTPYIFNLVHWI
jgi:hypothetical protein